MRLQPQGCEAPLGVVASSRLFSQVALVAGLVGGTGLVLLGSSCGFQHYLMLVPLVLALQSHRSHAVRAAAVALTILGYLMLDMAGPVWPQPAATAQWLYRANAALGLLLLSALAFAYAGRFKAVQARLLRTVSSDLLTGLLNRRNWTETVERRLARVRKDSEHPAMGLLIVGIDHLRPLNDRHGNSTGDQVLGAVATTLQYGLREGDLLARWGGDQFMALIAGSDAKTSRMAGERLRALVQAATVRVATTGEVLSLTVSVGVTALDPNEPLDAAIARADSALVEAKQTGRNRVAVSRG